MTIVSRVSCSEEQYFRSRRSGNFYDKDNYSSCFVFPGKFAFYRRLGLGTEHVSYRFVEPCTNIRVARLPFLPFPVSIIYNVSLVKFAESKQPRSGLALRLRNAASHTRDRVSASWQTLRKIWMPALLFLLAFLGGRRNSVKYKRSSLGRDRSNCL